MIICGLQNGWSNFISRFVTWSTSACNQYKQENNGRTLWRREDFWEGQDVKTDFVLSCFEAVRHPSLLQNDIPLIFDLKWFKIFWNGVFDVSVTFVLYFINLFKKKLYVCVAVKSIFMRKRSHQEPWLNYS